MQRVHHARDEPAEGAESHPPHHPQGDRANGADHPQEVLFHSDAAQAVHLRGCHDPPIALPRRKVCHACYFDIGNIITIWRFFRKLVTKKEKL